MLHDVFAAPEYDWSERSRTIAWLAEQYGRLVAALASLEQTHPAAYYALVVAMTLVLVVMLVHFGYVLRVAFRPVASTAPTRTPAAAARDAEWYVGEARRLAAEARYAEALGHRFLALLLDLQGRDALSFHASKTPAEYLHEVRLDEDGRGRFRTLVMSLYQHLFAGIPCTADQWASFDAEAELLGGRVATG